MSGLGDVNYVKKFLKGSVPVHDSPVVSSSYGPIWDANTNYRGGSNRVFTASSSSYSPSRVGTNLSGCKL